MNDSLSKEHYCYKIHALLIKSSAYPPYKQRPYMNYLPPILKRKS